MWRSALSARLLLRSVPLAPTLYARPVAAAVAASSPADHPIRPPWSPLRQLLSSSSSSTASNPTPTPSSSPSAAGPAATGTAGGDPVSFSEARRLMRLINVESLKRKLEKEGQEVIPYTELIKVCEGMGVARTDQEAEAFVKVLDEAGVVLLFRDKVYLHPDKVVDLMRKAVPLALTPEDDPRRLELKELQKRKEEIDVLAHKQVRRILWSGLGFFIGQISLFFRLTFWEFSWDVMEPIAFFTTTAGLIVGYAYFLFTSRDPTYQDLMHRLFQSRQRKLVQKRNFDLDRYLELQRRCKCPLDDPKGTGIESFLRE